MGAYEQISFTHGRELYRTKLCSLMKVSMTLSLSRCHKAVKNLEAVQSVFGHEASQTFTMVNNVGEMSTKKFCQ